MNSTASTGHLPVRLRLERDWYVKPLCIFAFIVWGLSLPLFGVRQVRAEGRHITVSHSILPYVEVPFDYYRHQILVTGEVNGVGNLTFVLDTGATMSVLDSGVDVQGEPSGETRMQDLSGVSSAGTQRVGTIRILGPSGSIDRHDVPMLTSDLRQLQEVFGRRIDGILGIGFLANNVTQIDYGRQVLRFYDPSLYAVDGYEPDNRSSFLFDMVPTGAVDRDPCMVVNGRLNGGYRYDFLLDTGYGGSVSVTRNAAQESRMCPADDASQRTVSYTMNSAVSSEQLAANDMSIGTLDLTGRQVSVDDRSSGAWGTCGIVGNALLEDYEVTIDYPRHKLWLVRTGGGPGVED